MIEPQRPATAHPVQFDVAYPERLSRWLIFVKIILVIPHLFAVGLLMYAVAILTVLAWFSILFTGRYPKAFFEFNAGVLRWASNAFAYAMLLRDEYPPFSWEQGEYPLTLDIPRAERQSRFRLFIRAFAIVPNYIVFYFVQIAWYITTFIAWWAILFTGRYPRGLFRFNVGVMRWYNRMTAYIYLLRDEYPPYSIGADARPGNEVISAIIGLPLLAGYIALYAAFIVGPMLSGGETVRVNAALLESPVALERAAPSASGSGLRITLLAYDDAPRLSVGELPRPGYRIVEFRLVAEKDSWLPVFYTPYLFMLEDCFGYAHPVDFEQTENSAPIFEMFWRGGSDDSFIYFEFPANEVPCALNYFNTVAFEFR